MIFEVLDRHIRQAFSNSASHYEALAGMQYEIGRELLAGIALKDKTKVLDVGMGTGRLTNRLAMSWPQSWVIGMDFAPGMLEVASKKYETLSLLQAHANHIPIKDDMMDFVISNLALQWVRDLQQAFAEIRRVLKPSGELHATLFARRTLHELYVSLDQTKKTPGFAFRRLHDLEEIKLSLAQAGFRDIECRVEINETHFEDLYSILQWVKDIGANAMNRNFYLGPKHLQEAAQYYERHYQGRWGVRASFEVIWVKGRK